MHRSRLLPLEEADKMSAQLDIGNLADVEDNDDEEHDLIFKGTGNCDCVLDTSNTPDESNEEQASKNSHGAEKLLRNPQLIRVELVMKMSLASMSYRLGTIISCATCQRAFVLACCIKLCLRAGK